MAIKLPRVLQKIFASTSPNGDVAVYGSLAEGNPTYTKDIQQLQSEIFEQGIAPSRVEDKAPFLEDENAINLTITQQLAYLLQIGIPEYLAEENYYIGSRASVVNAGKATVYKSLTNDNVGNNPITDLINWVRIPDMPLPKFQYFIVGGSDGEWKALTLQETQQLIGQGNAMFSALSVGTEIFSYSNVAPAGAVRANGQWLSSCDVNYPILYDAVVKGHLPMTSTSAFDAEVAKVGSCGKFVLNGTSIRVPNRNNFSRATNTLSELGASIDDKIRNIKGSFAGAQGQGNNYTKGAFKNGSRSVLRDEPWEGYYTTDIDFDANNNNTNNPMAGHADGDEITPRATHLYCYIVTKGIDEVFQAAELSAEQAASSAIEAQASAESAQQIADRFPAYVESQIVIFDEYVDGKKEEVQELVDEAETQAQNSASSAIDAKNFANNASSSATNASNAANNASSYASAAQNSATGANTANQSAISAASASAASAANAAQSATNAATSETNANNSAQQAEEMAEAMQTIGFAFSNYSSTAYYQYPNIVYFDGSSYGCKSKNTITGIQPDTNTTVWQILSAGGGAINFNPNNTKSINSSYNGTDFSANLNVSQAPNNAVSVKDDGAFVTDLSDTKLDKITVTGDAELVYTSGGDGRGWEALEVEPAANSVVKRGDIGNVKVFRAEEPDDATPKSYVDNSFLTEVTSTNLAVTQSDFVTKLTTTNKGLTQADGVQYKVLPNNTDFNTLNVFGDYSIYQDGNVLDFNQPVKGSAALTKWLLSVRGENYDIIQTAYGTGVTSSNFPNTYRRRYISTGWSAWIAIDGEFLTPISPSNKGLTQADVVNVGNISIYVNTETGSDTTGDGTAAKPYQTLYKAIQVAGSYYQLGLSDVDIVLANGQTFDYNLNFFPLNNVHIITVNDALARATINFINSDTIRKFIINKRVKRLFLNNIEFKSSTSATYLVQTSAFEGVGHIYNCLLTVGSCQYGLDHEDGVLAIGGATTINGGTTANIRLGSRALLIDAGIVCNSSPQSIENYGPYSRRDAITGTTVNKTPTNTSMCVGYYAQRQVPSNRYINLTLNASGSEYTASADGFVSLYMTSTVADAFILLRDNEGSNIAALTRTFAIGQTIAVNIPVRKGEKFIASYTPSNTISFFKFTYAENTY